MRIFLLSAVSRSYFLTGLLLRIPMWDGLNISNVFDDESYWILPSKLTKDQEGTLRSQLSNTNVRTQRYSLDPPVDYVVNMIEQQNARIQANLANRRHQSTEFKSTEIYENGVQL